MKNLTEEAILRANKPMQICSTSLDIRKLQIKTTIRCHYVPFEMVKKKLVTTPKSGEDAQTELLVCCWREC